VGPALPDVQVKLSEEGELLVRGPNVMRGYWRDQEATTQVLRDGWLHTGDLADIDPDGHIRIVGRLKDLIVNSGGDNIAPAPIEQEITLYPEVDQIVVVGDAKPWLSAVICLNPDFETQDPQALVYDILKRYNKDKPSLVQLRKAIVMDEPCSIENGLLTPTQKIKRPKLIALYREAIDALYGPMASSQ
jgi:long-chain acyl-CoA synthetase